ncbi:PREDICTED: uncharacterized protein LOC105458829 [Wasmannia auropunctata]|uniref:uncharacterized protein LOC105458829 n=1 Tax=Wasmannia auropunctata TaxID=64793 RepID=UPI0005EDE207|nr:PREDICTED: uncharacterized protein LOC105458829 [Wasmannia auropunctata]
MEFSVDQQYRVNRLVLSIYGLWPYHNRTATAWIKRIFIFSFMIYTVVIQVIKICMTELTTDFILDCLPIIIPNVGAIIQFLNRVLINDKLRDLFDQIKIDWECARSQNEIEIMQENATGAKVTTKLFLLYMFVGITVYMFSTFIPQVLDVFLPLNESRSREHPFHVELFLDDDKYFYFIRFFMYFGLLYGLGVILANGTIFVVYMQHASGMFTILGYMGQQLIDTSTELSMKM